MTHPFVKTFHDILSNKQIGLTDKMLLAALRFHCGSNGSCYPSIPTLREEIGVKEDCTVHRALKRLIDMGLVKKTSILGKPNQYELLTPGSDTTTISDTPGPKPGGFKPQTPVSNHSLKERKEKNKKIQSTPLPPKGGNHRLPLLKKLDELEKALAAQVVLDDFRAIWEPESVDVDACYKQFAKYVLTGSAKKPFPNPSNWRDFKRAFTDSCERWKRDHPPRPKSWRDA